MPDHPDKKRRFVRHPSDIPVEISEIDVPTKHDSPRLSNISFTGLAFVCQHRLKKDSIIHFRISFVEPTFEADGRVAWATEVDNEYRIGVEFLGGIDAYRGRMVEQVCYIEHYRRRLSVQRGEEVSSEEAAKDWIEKYAEEFP